MYKNITVFGIRDLEEEMRPIAMFIVSRYIWKTITSSMKKRLFIVDEAWVMMKHEDGASFLFGLVKRARKYWLGVSTITQDVSDFMSSSYGKPIVNNSALKILLKQSPAVIDTVQEIFNLTGEEKSTLLEGEVGEGIFFAGQKHVVIRITASYAEDQIITSSPEELQKIKQAKTGF
jgi:conjugal transfer ATP-binding protein TraC